MALEGAVIEPEIISVGDVHLDVVICVFARIMAEGYVLEDNITRAVYTSEMYIVKSACSESADDGLILSHINLCEG